MDRVRYARYVAARAAESLAIMLAAAAVAVLLERHGALRPPDGYCGTLFRREPGWMRGALPALAGWLWPVAFAAAAHVLLGPKQRRPVYRKYPGTLYAYAGVRVDRNAGCRGGLVTGATGSGKTLCCIVPRLHSLCVNECGEERRDWPGSPLAREFSEARSGFLLQDTRLRQEIALLRRAGSRPVGGPEDSAERRAELLRWQGDLRSLAFQAVADRCRLARFRVPPWGGFVCGEKGTEWQMLEGLLRAHGRAEDLCVLKTRPPAAPPDWRAAVRFNLLSMGDVAPDTYAQMIVDTALSVEEAQTRDEFFVPQARDKIAWGIRLLRAVERADPGAAPPTLVALLDLLTVPESYRQILLRGTALDPGLSADTGFADARFQLENNYWNQPPDQLGGVRSTIHNFLVPFSEPEIAAVFCTDSTFDLREIQLGKVVSLAIPQRHAVQRRYAATLLKSLAYQVVLERFDRSQDQPDWRNRNVVLVEQDEWQRHAVRADCEVDIVREARGAVYAATQSQNAVWRKLGGRDQAAPLLANLRNRWICQAATEDCAEESSLLVGSRAAREESYTDGGSGRTTTVSFPERPVLPKRDLRTLPPFHVVFAPAEGPWLYRTCIAMPATPDGGIPDWWFGDWNPLHWASHALGLPEKVAGLRLHPGEAYVPPWRASAPARAQVRRLLGLDGTFIVLGGARSGRGR